MIRWHTCPICRAHFGAGDGRFYCSGICERDSFSLPTAPRRNWVPLLVAAVVFAGWVIGGMVAR